MKAKDLLLEAISEKSLSWPEIHSKFPAMPKITAYQALSSLKAAGKVKSVPISRGGRLVDRSRGARKMWVACASD